MSNDNNTQAINAASQKLVDAIIIPKDELQDLLVETICRHMDELTKDSQQKKDTSQATEKVEAIRHRIPPTPFTSSLTTSLDI